MRKALYVMGILDDSDVQWLASNGRRSAISKGDVLIREGQPVDALFIVLDGALDVTVGRKSVATLLAGEILGEISFVDSRPPSATVTASRNPSCWRLRTRNWTPASIRISGSRAVSSGPSRHFSPTACA